MITLIEPMRQQGLRADVRPLFASPTLAALAAATSGRVAVTEVSPNAISSAADESYSLKTVL